MCHVIINDDDGDSASNCNRIEYNNKIKHF